MTVLFEPQFLIGDQVYLKMNPEKKFVIDGYLIKSLTENQEVDFFQYSIYDSEGNQYFFTDKDLELQESHSKK